ncbi:PIN domain-containing protein [Aliarcobacter skirrowii]|uniref:PIN domain-containing protein n=1 Tax=Aliarcobacter skirrowii TaxID=28200 RepID=UPI0029B34B5F|nr:PIN domain-containing protein [Aliarcobacter skirrowii]MDX4050796.1 PIN domain-containing protein [Aliarcobacter skirrowii]
MFYYALLIAFTSLIYLNVFIKDENSALSISFISYFKLFIIIFIMSYVTFVVDDFYSYLFLCFFYAVFPWFYYILLENKEAERIESEERKRIKREAMKQARERERIEKEKKEAEKLKERKEAEKLEKERKEAEKLEKERKRIEREKKEAEKRERILKKIEELEREEERILKEAYDKKHAMYMNFVYNLKNTVNIFDTNIFMNKDYKFIFDFFINNDIKILMTNKQFDEIANLKISSNTDKKYKARFALNIIDSLSKQDILNIGFKSLSLDIDNNAYADPELFQYCLMISEKYTVNFITDDRILSIKTIQLSKKHNENNLLQVFNGNEFINLIKFNIQSNYIFEYKYEYEYYHSTKK